MKKTRLVRPLAAGAVLVLATVLSLSACGATGSSANSGSAASSAVQSSDAGKSSASTSTDDKVAKSVDLKIAEDGAVSFTDDLGNTVTVKKPKHVVA